MTGLTIDPKEITKLLVQQETANGAENYMIKSPTSQQIKEAREQSDLTQTQAAKSIYCSLGAWQKWELGTRIMHPAFWELFLIKTNMQK